ncbi:MAG: ArsI/CadI family heavy metal resistance metalloenzyme [Paracoccus sp. (in: a-proteobacteria)]|nr:ArsI/CadI family heavy metal resistance metalloenzyme [Paracoccus sp. (in: a-proteobacteria)]
MNIQTDLSAESPAWSRRPHININVNDIEASANFYAHLFGIEPTKRRADYAKFESNDPPMNVALLEFPSPTKRDGHFGIQVKSSAQVEAIGDRLREAGVNVKQKEEEVACCYSVQTKVWAVDPDGYHWEIFVSTGDAPQAACNSDCDCICFDEKTGGCSWS